MAFALGSLFCSAELIDLNLLFPILTQLCTWTNLWRGGSRDEFSSKNCGIVELVGFFLFIEHAVGLGPNGWAGQAGGRRQKFREFFGL